MALESNRTGLRYALESTTLGTLPGSPVWRVLEPNTYSDFGAQISTTARNPIREDRQRPKGVTTDLDASGGFTHDLTTSLGMRDMLRSFFFAAWRLKDEDAVTATNTTAYTIASGGADYLTNSLVWASGFTNSGNNGLKKVTATTGTTVTVGSLTTEASPPSTAQIKRVGYEAASGDITITNSGGVKTLGSTTLNFTTLGLIPGEWIFIGGDTTATQFATAANNGFARIVSIAANAIVVDKTQGTWVTDNGASKTIRIFFGDVLKNESASNLIVRQSIQLERKLDSDKFEYLVGAVANQMTLNFGTADKVTTEMSFVGTDRTTASVAATGTRPNLESGIKSFNTTSDMPRLRLADSADTGLSTFVQEFSITINNNATAQKAIGLLGAHDIVVGDFMVEGTLTAYFSSTATIDAVRNNSDVTLDFATVVDNKGYVFDLPLLSLGNGQVNVEKDQAIKIPVSLAAAAHGTLNHTMLVMRFDYLPALAG